MGEHTDTGLEAATQRWMWAGVVLMAVLVLAFPLYRLYEPSARADARERQQIALASDGHDLFVSGCGSCHGDEGQGVDAPALYSKQFLDEVTEEQIESIVAHGIPGSPMRAWGIDDGGPLTSEQIHSIAVFLLSLRPDAPDRPDWRDPGGAGD